MDIMLVVAIMLFVIMSIFSICCAVSNEKKYREHARKMRLGLYVRTANDYYCKKVF